MTLTQKLFSFKGRINRQPFWLCSIAASIAINFIMIGVGMLGFDSILPYLLILYIPLIWISIALTVKRLHDLDKSGWLTLLVLVPFVNIYIFIITGFFKGTVGKNRFGEDPLGGTTPNSNQEAVEL